MIEGYPEDLTPEWRRWVDMASAQIIRHMDGGHLIPVSYAFAAASVRKQEEAEKTQARRPHRAKTYVPSSQERQIIAGAELGMSDDVIGRNISLLPRIVKKMREKLEDKGLIDYSPS